MKNEDIIDQLEDLKLDRESFFENNKFHDEIFLQDYNALDNAIKKLKSIQELKKNILESGYYDDESGKNYIVEIRKEKLFNELKKIFNAKEIKII